MYTRLQKQQGSNRRCFKNREQHRRFTPLKTIIADGAFPRARDKVPRRTNTRDSCRSTRAQQKRSSLSQADRHTYARTGGCSTADRIPCYSSFQRAVAICSTPSIITIVLNLSSERRNFRLHRLYGGTSDRLTQLDHIGRRFLLSTIHATSTQDRERVYVNHREVLIIGKVNISYVALWLR